MPLPRHPTVTQCPGRHFPTPEYRKSPSAPDTLYGHGACTVVISFNGGNEFRLFMTTGATARRLVAGPTALRKIYFVASEGFPELREMVIPLQTTVSQSVEPALCLNHLEIPTNHTDGTAKREHRSASRRRVRQHTPALRLQPESALPSLPAFALHAFCPALSKPGIRTTPAARRSRKANQGGAGGIISPALPFCLDIFVARVPRPPGCPRHTVLTLHLHAARCVSLLPFRLFLTFD